MFNQRAHGTGLIHERYEGCAQRHYVAALPEVVLNVEYLRHPGFKPGLKKRSLESSGFRALSVEDSEG